MSIYSRSSAVITFSGTDLLCLGSAHGPTGGQITEYWVNSDMNVLLAQLGVLPA